MQGGINPDIRPFNYRDLLDGDEACGFPRFTSRFRRWKTDGRNGCG